MSEDDLWLEFERWRELADWHTETTGRTDLAEDATFNADDYFRMWVSAVRVRKLEESGLGVRRVGEHTCT